MVNARLSGRRGAKRPNSFNDPNAETKISAEISTCQRLGRPPDLTSIPARPLVDSNCVLFLGTKNLRSRLIRVGGLTAFVSIKPRKPTLRPFAERRRAVSIATTPPNEYP